MKILTQKKTRPIISIMIVLSIALMVCTQAAVKRVVIEEKTRTS